MLSFKKRKGVSSLEFLLNVLIYIPIFILLFQIAVIPLQQFYLTQAARSGALIYIQIRHYDGKSKEIKGILDEMVPGKSDKLPEGIRNNAEEITKYLIKSEFINSANGNSLPGKLFNTSKIDVSIDDTGEIQPSSNLLVQLIKNIGKSITQTFFTEGVAITVKYPFTLLQFFNLSFGTFNIEGLYSVRYNP